MSEIPPARRRVRALLLDFDGLIVDTESPAYDSWNEVYAEHGREMDLLAWADCISNRESTFDPLDDLEHLLGPGTIDAMTVAARRNRRKDELTDMTELLPGIREYIHEAKALGLKLGIASGSSRGWVTRHLQRLGVAEGWDCLRCRDDVERSKPHPDSYLALLDCLGVAADEAIALEDSPNGIRAAQAAGILCVAVPNDLTRRLDLSGADMLVQSLGDHPLARLLADAGAIRRQAGPAGAR
jgi:HAD superfamily hydrolase (TIGR01509 family)